MTQRVDSASAPPHSGRPVVRADPELLAQRARALLGSRRRVIIGIVGAPGSGKSTLAAAVLDELTGGDVPLRTALVPMDGFHLAQRVLDDTKLAEVKGAPETFDAAGYVELLRRLGAPAADDSASTVFAPEFRRAIEEPIAGAIPVAPDVRVVITEGNYLLLDRPPWDRVSPLLDQSWYLDTPDELRVDRLVSRHIAFGRSPEVARDRAVNGTDGRNAAIVWTTRPLAGVLVRPD